LCPPFFVSPEREAAATVGRHCHSNVVAVSRGDLFLEELNGKQKEPQPAVTGRSPRRTGSVNGSAFEKETNSTAQNSGQRLPRTRLPGYHLPLSPRYRVNSTSQPWLGKRRARDEGWPRVESAEDFSEAVSESWRTRRR
jgi:hypothetical protein